MKRLLRVVLAAALAGGWLPARLAQRMAPAQSLKGLGSDAAGAARTRWSAALPALLLLAALPLALLPPVGDLPLPAYAAVAGGTTPNPSTVVGAHGYASGTNVKGHIFKLSYSPFDMLTLSATWYRTQVINEQLIAMPGYNWDSSMNRLQIDAILKF